MAKSGIYSITNFQSGRVYYGSSNNIEKLQGIRNSYKEWRII